MKDLAASIVMALADGRPRDRAILARDCGIGEASLVDGLRQLTRFGVALNVEQDAVALSQPVDLLDTGRILRDVPRLRSDAAHVRFAVGSTNTVLSERLRAGARVPEVCTAEIQTAGRGRRGQAWLSGLGQSLALSVSWRFTERAQELSGFSLAVGVALAETLAAGGFEGVMLKWPNDLVVDNRKLAGILVETSHPRPGSAACVVGVGLNLDLATAASRGIDQPWTDFAREFGCVPSRSALASQAINAILDACELFGDQGLAPYAARWGERDALRDRPVRVLSGRTPTDGVSRGIDGDGALLVEHATGVVRCLSDEVRVRARTG